MAYLVPESAPAAGDLHFILCDFGGIGQAYIETDPARADRESAVEDILSGEIARPLKVIALHTDGTWDDVSADIALELIRMAAARGDDLSDGTLAFIGVHTGRGQGEDFARQVG
jgi:hypothetical protein